MPVYSRCLQDAAALRQAWDAPDGPLAWAIRRGKAGLLPQLIAQGADPNGPSPQMCHGQQLLGWAAVHGSADAVRLLLDGGAAIDQQDSRGWTALVAAAAAGRLSVVQTLLQRGADVHLRTKRCSSALLQAANKGHAAVVAQLLQHVVSAGLHCCDDGQLALEAAVGKSHSAVVAALLQHAAGANLNRSNDLTALLMAAYHGDAAAAEQLLAGPSAAELLNERNGGTALRAAAAGGQPALVALLLQHGVPENARADTTPILAAALHGRLEVAQLLLDKGASIDWRNRKDRAALLRASERGHTHIACLLLRQLDDNICADALRVAVEAGQAALVFALLPHVLQWEARLMTSELRTLRMFIPMLQQECQASGVVRLRAGM